MRNPGARRPDFFMAQIGCGSITVAIGPVAAAFVSIAAAMITPYRITQIQITWIGRGTDHSACHRAGGSAQAGISRRCANHCTACSTYQGSAGGAITGVGATTRNQQSRGKSCNQHSCAHDHLLVHPLLRAITHRRVEGSGQRYLRSAEDSAANRRYSGAGRRQVATGEPRRESDPRCFPGASASRRTGPLSSRTGPSATDTGCTSCACRRSRQHSSASVRFAAYRQDRPPG